MKAQQEGRIVSVTSGRGIGGQLKGTHYSASKAGIMAFTKSLSLELAPCGINVNTIAPGAMDTPLWRSGRSAQEIQNLLEKESRLSNPLLRRVYVPEDIVGAVLFLLTDASKVITGQTIFLRTS
jgi:3-oxoacyl-[acyl-carrier protein] reductase